MLSIEDITSLGFTYYENSNWFIRDTITIAAANIIYKHSNYIQIWKGDVKKKTDLLLFQGCVENKAELEKLLEQVDLRIEKGMLKAI